MFEPPGAHDRCPEWSVYLDRFVRACDPRWDRSCTDTVNDLNHSPGGDYAIDHVMLDRGLENYTTRGLRWRVNRGRVQQRTGVVSSPYGEYRTDFSDHFPVVVDVSLVPASGLLAKERATGAWYSTRNIGGQFRHAGSALKGWAQGTGYELFAADLTGDGAQR